VLEFRVDQFPVGARKKLKTTGVLTLLENCLGSTRDPLIVEREGLCSRVKARDSHRLVDVDRDGRVKKKSRKVGKKDDIL
jgi:hypothetical protein